MSRKWRDPKGLRQMMSQFLKEEVASDGFTKI
jgi:hypothetical protein